MTTNYITINRKVVEQALEALTQITSCAIGTAFGREFKYQVGISTEAITALRAAIEAAEKQEPVAEVVEGYNGSVFAIRQLVWTRYYPKPGTKLYTAPQPAIPEGELLGAVARGWCSAKNSHKEMDATLAEAICKEVQMLLSAAPKPEDV